MNFQLRKLIKKSYFPSTKIPLLSWKRPSLRLISFPKFLNPHLNLTKFNSRDLPNRHHNNAVRDLRIVNRGLARFLEHLQIIN